MKFIDLTQNPQKELLLKEPGQYVIFFFNYSGDVDVKIEAPNIDVSLLGLYVGKDKNEYFLNTTQHHKQKESISNLLVKGVFYDASQFSYEGLIKIDPQGQKTHAYQKNQNIIMGDKVQVSSNPFLEISANDVFCTHGSTTGKLPEEELHYLKTRGITTQAANKLLISGFIEEIFQTMHQLNVDDKIIETYKKKAQLLLS